MFSKFMSNVASVILLTFFATGIAGCGSYKDRQTGYTYRSGTVNKGSNTGYGYGNDSGSTYGGGTNDPYGYYPGPMMYPPPTGYPGNLDYGSPLPPQFPGSPTGYGSGYYGGAY